MLVLTCHPLSQGGFVALIKAWITLINPMWYRLSYFAVEKIEAQRGTVPLNKELCEPQLKDDPSSYVTWNLQEIELCCTGSTLHAL